jgi:hypothetical protein
LSIKIKVFLKFYNKKFLNKKFPSPYFQLASRASASRDLHVSESIASNAIPVMRDFSSNNNSSDSSTAAVAPSPTCSTAGATACTTVTTTTRSNSTATTATTTTADRDNKSDFGAKIGVGISEHLALTLPDIVGLMADLTFAARDLEQVVDLAVLSGNQVWI